MLRVGAFSAVVLCAGCVADPVFEGTGAAATTTTATGGSGATSSSTTAGSPTSSSSSTGAGGSNDGGGGSGPCDNEETEWFPPCGGLVDTFEDPAAFAIDWIAEGGIGVDGGTLNVSVDPANEDGRAYTVDPVPLAACQVSVTIVQLPAPTEAYASLFVHTGAPTGGPRYTMRANATTLEVFAPGDVQLTRVPFDLGATPHIRIRASRGTLHFERSADRVCWSSIFASMQPVDFTPVTVGMNVDHLLGGESASAKFDDLNVPAP